MTFPLLTCHAALSLTGKVATQSSTYSVTIQQKQTIHTPGLEVDGNTTTLSVTQLQARQIPPGTDGTLLALALVSSFWGGGGARQAAISRLLGTCTRPKASRDYMQSSAMLQQVGSSSSSP
jgi:hypothetical protein